MSITVLLLKMVKTRDAEGKPVWLEVPADVAEVLNATEPKLKERLLKNPDRLEKVAAAEDAGPRFRFSWLVGESRTWNGPLLLRKWGIEGGRMEDLGCQICDDAELPPWAYCLGCDRTGRELDIASPGPAKGRIRPIGGGQGTNGLKGGRS